MKILHWGKDGGDESKVWGFWLVEIKSLFSIVLLQFRNGTREVYHDHAFNCFSWVLKGYLLEKRIGRPQEYHPASWRPFVTRRTTAHKVESFGTTWVLSFRGPWAKTWCEYTFNRDGTHRCQVLGHGRVKV